MQFQRKNITAKVIVIVYICTVYTVYINHTLIPIEAKVWNRDSDVKSCRPAVVLCDSVFVSLRHRWTCLVSVQTSMETGITTGRRTIWQEHSDTQEFTMETMNTTSLCCWRTNTKSRCLKGGDAALQVLSRHCGPWMNDDSSVVLLVSKDAV